MASAETWLLELVKVFVCLARCHVNLVGALNWWGFEIPWFLRLNVKGSQPSMTQVVQPLSPKLFYILYIYIQDLNPQNTRYGWVIAHNYWWFPFVKGSLRVQEHILG